MREIALKTGGILGGMGPGATVDLLQRVIANTPAEDDADHIHLLVDNNPQVPSRIKALIDGDGESPVPTLIAMAKKLEGNGFYGASIGLTVVAGAYLFGEVSTAAFNPAVAIGCVLMGVVAWTDIWIFLLANFLGAYISVITFNFLTK